MTQYSIFFDNKTNKQNDATLPYSAIRVREAFNALGSSGVIKNEDNELVVTAPDNTDDIIRIASGQAFLAGIFYRNTTAFNMNVPTVTQGTAKRLVIEYSLVSGDANYKQARLKILNGTQGLLTPPAVTQNALTVYQLSLYTFVQQANGDIALTDTRQFTGSQYIPPIPNNSITAAQTDSTIAKTATDVYLTQSAYDALVTANTVDTTKRYWTY